MIPILTVWIESHYPIIGVILCATYGLRPFTQIILMNLFSKKKSTNNDANKVSMIKSFFSIILHAIYRAVCIQLTHFYCIDVCTLYYYHHQIGSMNISHCLGLGYETMVCAVCLAMFVVINYEPTAHLSVIFYFY